MISKKTKSKIISEFRVHQKDTGSAEVQVALLTKRIDELTHHLKKHPKDHHSRRGLLKIVNHRRKLLEYIKKNNPTSYNKIIKKLELK
jgi:small subunit ribosomal protein S15